MSKPCNHKSQHPLPPSKRTRTSLQEASLSLVHHYRDEIKKSQTYAAHLTSPPSVHPAHPHRSFTAAAYFSDPRSILSSPTSIDHHLLQQASPSHYSHVQHTSIHASDGGITIIAHFTNSDTFLAAIHDPSSPYFRSNLPLHSGGWLPSEHIERILLINVPGPYANPNDAAQQLKQHIQSATGHTPIHINFPNGTSSPRFAVTLELSTPVTTSILQQIYASPFQNTNLLSGGTANPKHHRCSCCHELGHQHHACPHREKVSVTIHTKIALYPYHLPKISSRFDCQVVPGIPEQPLPSDQKFKVVTLTFPSHKAFQSSCSKENGNLKLFFAHHQMTKFYLHEPHRLCTSCYHPIRVPSRTCPHHQPTAASSKSHRQQINPSSQLTSPSQPPQKSPQQTSQAKKQANNRYAALAQDIEPQNSQLLSQRPHKETSPSHRRSRSRTPKKRTSPKTHRKTRNRPSSRRHQYRTPPSSPRKKRQQRLHDSFSTMKLRPGQPKTKAHTSKPNPSPSHKPKPTAPIPISHLLTPCDPQLATCLTVIPNSITSELEQTLSTLAENPNLSYEQHGKAYEMSLFGKPKTAQPLEYSWSSGQYRLQSAEWHPAIEQTHEAISSILPQAKTFNSCLLNRFKNGNAYSPEHSDKQQVSKDPDSVALLCLGTPREFHFKNKRTKQITKLILHPRTLLHLSPSCNLHFTHRRPKATSVTTPSYSYTFRSIPDVNTHE